MINPIELNTNNSKDAWVYDAITDKNHIDPYLRLDNNNEDGQGAIAISPIWNSDRIVLQRGMFTLHGKGKARLTGSDATSLCYLLIKNDVKTILLQQLEKIGVDEMSIFPEPEHLCNQLMRRVAVKTKRMGE